MQGLDRVIRIHDRCLALSWDLDLPREWNRRPTYTNKHRWIPWEGSSIRAAPAVSVRTLDGRLGMWGLEVQAVMTRRGRWLGGRLRQGRRRPNGVPGLDDGHLGIK